VLEARNITINYGLRKAVADVSVVTKPGEVIAIIGPNGAGKSTLLRALNGTVEPIEGEILLDGTPINSYARRAVARRVAVVAQEADLRFPITVMEFVLGGRYASSSAWGWESEHDLEVARRVLRETETKEFESRFMNELSGGERQRAVLARALATEASVLLLDEPTANLDLAHQAAMLRLVRARCSDRESAAVVVTHDVNLAAEFADRVVLLKAGGVVASGSATEVLSSELLKSVFELDVLVDAHPVTGAPRITPVYESRDEG
jgi:iron complex transport system ATP-binding protein